MTLFVCGGCNHVAVESAPEKCPLCGSPKTHFVQNDRVFEDAKEKSKEGAAKHTPAITVSKECGLVPENDCIDILVRVGEVLHPMTPEHYIEWIDCYVDGVYVARTFLTPAANPSVIFHLQNTTGKVQIVEYCSLHGHWLAETDL